MKLEKPNRSVSNMDVLKDIRGLLSVTREREDATADGISGKSSLEVEITRLEAQIRDYKQLVQKQQEELRRHRAPVRTKSYLQLQSLRHWVRKRLNLRPG
jgi:hypothetical protein